MEPPAPPADVLADVLANEVVMQMGDRRWQVRGLARHTGFDTLKVNLLVSEPGGAFHVDTLDLYSARARQAYTRQAAGELGLEEHTVKGDVGRVLLRLEELAADDIQKAQEPVKKPHQLSDEESAAALDLLRDPRLLDRILSDFDRLGVVGEETNKLVGYMAATSRKLDRPLAVIVQSTSAAGKSALIKAVLSLMPETEVVKQAMGYHLGRSAVGLQTEAAASRMQPSWGRTSAPGRGRIDRASVKTGGAGTGPAARPAGGPCSAAAVADDVTQPALRGREVLERKGVGVLALREPHPPGIHAGGDQADGELHRGLLTGGGAVVGNSPRA